MRVIGMLLLLACEQADGDKDVDTPGDEATPTETAPTTDLTWHADIRPIAERGCVGCHGGEGVGGFSLDGYDAFVEWSQASRAAVSERTMPPWRADGDCNSYQNDFSLSDEEVASVVGWIDGGMPEGSADTYPGDVTPWQPVSLDRVDLTLSMPEVYTPDDAPDDYRCFLLEWPYDDDVWVTGYEFQPGNLDVVHHIIPFIIAPDDAAAYRALDAAEDGAGYTCFGGPGGDVFALARLGWLGSWAPGSSASLAPEGTGVRVKPGSLVAMQVHYYTAAGKAPDQSSVDLRVETEPQGWMEIQPWTDITWVAGLGMEIPPNTTGVQHRFTYTAEAGDRFQINTAGLHMHTHGRAARLSVVRASGEEDCVLDVPNYDFNWQRDYALSEPVTVMPGDTVTLECTWDNPTDETISWGDGTGDEMCLGITALSGISE